MERRSPYFDTKRDSIVDTNRYSENPVGWNDRVKQSRTITDSEGISNELETNNDRQRSYQQINRDSYDLRKRDGSVPTTQSKYEISESKSY